MLYSTFAVAALAGASLVGAAPVINARKAAPTGWAHQVLEDYNAYHVRYLALECYKQHDTQFFDECCRPLRASQSLENDRPEQCRPSAEALAAAQSKVDARASATPSGASALPEASAIPSDDAGAEYVSVAFDAPTSTTDATTQAPPTETSTQDAPASTTTTDATTDAPTETPTETTTKTTKTTTTTDEPAPTDSGNSNNGGDSPSGTTYQGTGTFYMQDEGADPSGLGSCGYKNSDSDFIAAVSTTHGSSWGNTLCGKYLMVKNNANGKTVKVQAVDNCPTCKSADSLDLSKPAFLQIAAEETGEIDITWWII